MQRMNLLDEIKEDKVIRSAQYSLSCESATEGDKDLAVRREEQQRDNVWKILLEWN